MRINEISLTNFRSFKATQTIELAPVTLMFGPNSVGKSSVLLALCYVQQLLGQGHADPQRIDVLGDKHVGGFKSLVNEGDLHKRLVIKLRVDKTGRLGASYNQLAELLGEDFGLTVDSPCADAKSFAIELQVAWSHSLNSAYVACYKLWLDDQLIAELSNDAGLQQPVIEWLNYRHPALRCEADLEREESEESEESDESDESEFVSELQQQLNEYRQAQPTTRQESWHKPELTFLHAPLAFKAFAGALPRLGKRLETTFEHDDSRLTVRLHEILSDVLVAPLDNLLQLLNQSLHIGPLRMVPDALRQPNPYPAQKDWYSGAGAWDVVSKFVREQKAERVLALLNHWMGTLALGYSLRSKSVVSTLSYTGGPDPVAELLALFEAHQGRQLEVTLSTTDEDGNPEARVVPMGRERLEQFLAEHVPNGVAAKGAVVEQALNQWVLWDDLRDCEVAFNEVGVGISQLFPLIVAAAVGKDRLITCEQPELHVHPRIQVGIGDLISQANRGNSFIIETHSEHVILRLLRRVRETAEESLPDELSPLSPDDVSVVYLDSSAGGVKATRLHINTDGEFTSRWPKGFFAERSEELF